MNRRGFLTAILAAGIAPAVVKAASLMPVRMLDSGLLVPELEPILEPIEGIGGLYSQEFTSDGVFTVPRGVSMVWVTTIGGGGGGSASPQGVYRFDPPQLETAQINVPMDVRDKSIIKVTAGNGKNQIYTWIK